MLRALAFAIFCSLTLTCSAVTTDTCSSSHQQQLAAKALRIQAQLEAVKVDEMETDVPAPAQTLLPQFKAALEQTAKAVLGCISLAMPAEAIEQHLATLLHANLPPTPESSAPLAAGSVDGAAANVLGVYLTIHVRSASRSPQLLTIRFDFGITCGDDTLVLLFQGDTAHWRQQLIWQASPYSSIDKAFGDFFLTGLMPATNTHPLRIVAAHGHSWCTSRFSGFDVDVLEPTQDPDHPRVIWHTERGYSRGDFTPTLKTTPDTFEFRIHAPGLDPAVDYERLAIYRYRLEGEQVTRIEPIAGDGRGFVDEWIASPWPEAAAQSAPDSLDALHDAYETLKPYFSITNGPVRACSTAGLFQAEIDTTQNTPGSNKPGDRSPRMPPSFFFTFRQVTDGYRMLNVTHVPDPHCTGPDLMKTR